MGNYIVMRDYNISVLTMKVITLFISFLQNITSQTTNKAEFLQPPPFQMKSQFLPPAPFLLFEVKSYHFHNTIIFRKVDPPPPSPLWKKGVQAGKDQRNEWMHAHKQCSKILPTKTTKKGKGKRYD